MRFRDLMQLPYDTRSNVVDLAAIKEALPNTPEQVAFQVYSEHGRLTEFQNSYGDVAISELKWSLVPRSASRICAASRNPKFDGWFENVTRRASLLQAEGWRCIDSRPAVVAGWEANQSWITPPVFLAGTVVGSSASLHLVEGHTRVGTLCGLVKVGAISSDSQHEVWLGVH